MDKKINKKIFDAAKRVLVGGVDSPVRSFNYVGGDPVLIKSGKGSKVYDYDGNEYIDYVFSWGANILGHADPKVVKDVKNAAGAGFGFGTTNDLEVKLASIIRDAISFIDKIRFVNSGTEAVMGAIRLARGYTGRDKIVKFANSYHGHADYLLAKSGSGLATLNIPSSDGVPRGFIKDTIIAPPGDIEAVEAIFRKLGKRIAAVIIEPVGGNYGVLSPDEAYLKKLRYITRKYNSLLIFDEVITGFRFRFGSISQELGVVPDLICLGKIIGGGLPIGADGGREDIMNNLAPLGRVYQASTFSGNPIVMRSGLSTLERLKGLKNGYKRLENLAAEIVSKLEKAARYNNIGIVITQYKSIFSLKFDDKEKFKKFYHYILEHGIYFAPSEYEVNFISFSHTKKDIDYTAAIVLSALERIAR